MIRWLVPLVLFSLPLIVGCGMAAEKKTRAVTGKVTWNGAPLPDGDILFRPEDPSKVPEAGVIVNGTFEMQAKPGTNLVEIRACRPSKFDPVMGTTAPEPYIPQKYNTKTALRVEVNAAENAPFTFDLKEK
jgi:hypothetical protein